MQIGIVQFPGSNCERETKLAVQRVGMEPVDFLWNESREKLSDFDGFIIIGGFSYEDRSRAGIIAALDPVMQAIKAEADKGKPVLGICNGAQILVETGMVPGLEGNKVGVALTENKRVANDKILGTGYYNDWICMRVSDQFQRNAFTNQLTTKQVLHVPIAHGEGRFVMGDALLDEVKENGLNVFQYCNDSGDIVDAFPVNPNGSMNNIAALSNKAGNVMAMMPHPERTTNGDAIFTSMREYIKANHFVEVAPLNYYPRREDMKTYQPEANANNCIVELVITDNHAMTVENTLKHLGFDVRVKRYAYWEATCDDVTWEKVMQSGVLFNDRKEKIVDPAACLRDPCAKILVHPKEDMIGQQKLQTLADHFDISGVDALCHSIIWAFEGADEATINAILKTNIIANQYVHDCYRFDATL